MQDEPLNTYLDLGECPQLEEYASKSITDGCSFKALSPEGNIIGVFLNGLMHRPAPDAVRSSAAEGCEHAKFKKVLGLMDLVDSRYDFFAEYPDVDVALEGKILSVDPQYRGKGIANVLTRMTLDHMADNSIPIMFVMCSSHFSAQLLKKKFQFEHVFTLPYSEYLDEDGNQVLQPDAPHTQAEILIKRVERK